MIAHIFPPYITRRLKVSGSNPDKSIPTKPNADIVQRQDPYPPRRRLRFESDYPLHIKKRKKVNYPPTKVGWACKSPC